MKTSASTRRWPTSAAPTVSPAPCTTRTSPAGAPARRKSSSICAPTSGVSSDGFRTTAFPAATAVADLASAAGRAGSSTGLMIADDADRLVADPAALLLEHGCGNGRRSGDEHALERRASHVSSSTATKRSCVYASTSGLPVSSTISRASASRRRRSRCATRRSSAPRAASGSRAQRSCAMPRLGEISSRLGGLGHAAPAPSGSRVAGSTGLRSHGRRRRRRARSTGASYAPLVEARAYPGERALRRASRRHERGARPARR